MGILEVSPFTLCPAVVGPVPFTTTPAENVAADLVVLNITIPDPPIPPSTSPEPPVEEALPPPPPPPVFTVPLLPVHTVYLRLHFLRRQTASTRVPAGLIIHPLTAAASASISNFLCLPLI